MGSRPSLRKPAEKSVASERQPVTEDQNAAVRQSEPVQSGSETAAPHHKSKRGQKLKEFPELVSIFPVPPSQIPCSDSCGNPTEVPDGRGHRDENHRQPRPIF